MKCPNCGNNGSNHSIKIDGWAMEFTEIFFNPSNDEWEHDKIYDRDVGLRTNAEIQCLKCQHTERLKGEWDPRWGEELYWEVSDLPQQINEFKTSKILKELRHRTWWYLYVRLWIRPRGWLTDMLPLPKRIPGDTI